MRLVTLLLFLVAFAARAEVPSNETTPAAAPSSTASSEKSAVSNEDEFLPPEQAFKVDLRSSDGKIAVDFAPAPGHYLYRERISFSV